MNRLENETEVQIKGTDRFGFIMASFEREEAGAGWFYVIRLDHKSGFYTPNKDMYCSTAVAHWDNLVVIRVPK